ncbi:hypothetical protein PINS_up019775 [Pythium insidiosum]|nr:hypothetical protein PINS_up019775 [Pythium insidiosum]
MGRKVGDGLHFFSMAVSGITIGLIKGWELALILLAFTPFIAFTAFLAMKVLSTATQAGIESYGKAGAIAQESLSNIRTVHMFNAIDHFVKKYEGALGLSTQAGIKKGFAVGWGTGLMFFTVFCTYACGMFYGALKIANDVRDGCQSNCYDGGRVLTVFFSIIMGAMALGQAGPSVQAIFSARAAAYDVFEVINRASLIDPLSEDGKKLERVSGRIEIDSVSFAYPSRPEVKVCSNYSLRIEAGETVALVGPSGSGKSTIVVAVGAVLRSAEWVCEAGRCGRARAECEVATSASGSGGSGAGAVCDVDHGEHSSRQSRRDGRAGDRGGEDGERVHVYQGVSTGFPDGGGRAWRAVVGWSEAAHCDRACDHQEPSDPAVG